MRDQTQAIDQSRLPGKLSSRISRACFLFTRHWENCTCKFKSSGVPCLSFSQDYQSFVLFCLSIGTLSSEAVLGEAQCVGFPLLRDESPQTQWVNTAGIVSQFPWVRSLGVASLGPHQAEIMESSRRYAHLTLRILVQFIQVVSRIQFLATIELGEFHLL